MTAVAVPVGAPPPEGQLGEPETVAVASKDWTEEEDVSHCPGVTTVAPVSHIPSVNTVVVTEQLDVDGVPQVHGVQPRVSAADAQPGRSVKGAGHVWAPSLQMQERATKGAGGGGAQAPPPFGHVGPEPARPQTTASVAQESGGTVASPPAGVHDTLDEGGLTSKALSPGVKEVHFPATGVNVPSPKPVQEDFQCVCTDPGAHVAVDALHAQAAQVAGAAGSRLVPPRRTGAGYASGQLGEVPGGPS